MSLEPGHKHGMTMGRHSCVVVATWRNCACHFKSIKCQANLSCDVSDVLCACDRSCWASSDVSVSAGSRLAFWGRARLSGRKASRDRRRATGYGLVKSPEVSLALHSGGTLFWRYSYIQAYIRPYIRRGTLVVHPSYIRRTSDIRVPHIRLEGRARWS